MKWENLFAPHILGRGYDYFCDDAVENMEVSEDCVSASVLGTEEYEVEISLINGEVMENLAKELKGLKFVKVGE